MSKIRTPLIGSAVAALALCAAGAAAAQSADASKLDRSADAALEHLYQTNPVARVLAEKSRAVLVFPSIVKAGLVFGAGYGEGELKQGSSVDGYYNSFSGSWGLQAGAQSYGYVVFLMNRKAVDYVHDTHGWEIGVGPTVVVVNEGVAKNLSTSTLKDDAYAVIFDQQGLMASVSIEGTKISRIHP